MYQEIKQQFSRYSIFFLFITFSDMGKGPRKKSKRNISGHGINLNHPRRKWRHTRMTLKRVMMMMMMVRCQQETHRMRNLNI